MKRRAAVSVWMSASTLVRRPYYVSCLYVVNGPTYHKEN